MQISSSETFSNVPVSASAPTVNFMTEEQGEQFIQDVLAKTIYGRDDIEIDLDKYTNSSPGNNTEIPPVTTNNNAVSQLINNVYQWAKGLIDNTGNNNPDPVPVSPEFNVLTIDFVSNEQERYDLDGDGQEETEHSNVTTAGIKAFAPDAQVQVRKISNELDQGVSALEDALQSAQGKEIDALYLSIGIALTLDDYASLLGRESITAQELAQPENKSAVRALISQLPADDSTRRFVELIEEIEQYVPVYLSAGNDPAEVNVFVFAEGDNIERIGSTADYSSLVYDRAVETDFDWTKYQTGWDINGDQLIDLPFSLSLTEGTTLENLTQRTIVGGTSLGAPVALGQDIREGRIIDQATGLTLASQTQA